MKSLNKFYTYCREKIKEEKTLSSLFFLLKTKEPEYSNIASRMNIQLNYIYKYNSEWLYQKINTFVKAKKQTKENFNGLLGEINVYGNLLELKELNIFKISDIQMPEAGSDFIMILDNNEIHIEVNTPQKSSQKTTLQKINENSIDLNNKKINFKTQANAPYGYPQRKQDNIQYEAVSKFSQIKSDKENKQFLKDKISILWLDLNNPEIFPFTQIEQTIPISSFNGSISSGFIWNAFYSLKNDNIYSNLNNISKEYILMEFDGRFSDSNIDFVIIDCFTNKVIFENPNSDKKIPNSLYSLFFNLYNFNNKNSYLSFQNKTSLKTIIQIERNISNNLIHLYQ